ncbi:MAG: hypothetical protein ACLSA6_20335 [Holdemania massiliensis]
MSIAVAVGFAGDDQPFTIGIAREVSQVPLFSGLGYGSSVFVFMESQSLCLAVRGKVRKHPETSILAGES